MGAAYVYNQCMYNFRYHLITITSVFVALALGLLLGAAIATSDLAHTTTEDMVENVLLRYETLVEENTDLEQRLQSTSTLATDFVSNWSESRLDGRIVVLLLGNTLEDRNLQNDIAGTIRGAGGSVVTVTILKTDFGLNDGDTRTALQQVVEEVQGEEYQVTLAKRLEQEWSYSYSSSSVELTQDDFDLQRHTYTQSLSAANTELNAESGGSVVLDEAAITGTYGAVAPTTDFQKVLYEQYKLTRTLLMHEIISISTDYSPLIEHANPEAPTEQLAAYRVATAWQLPYSVNGLINGLAQQQNEAMMQSQIGMRLSLLFNEAGTNGELVYPAWLKTSIPKSTSGEVALPNYYVLLIQPSYLNESMELLARENSLSCATTPDTVTGHYSILALLSGAQAGIYGEDRSAENHFPSLPEDTSGRAVFK